MTNSHFHNTPQVSFIHSFIPQIPIDVRYIVMNSTGMVPALLELVGKIVNKKFFLNKQINTFLCGINAMKENKIL